MAGARVVARTALELYLWRRLVEEAWRRLREEQTAQQEYIPFIGPDDPPAIFLNRGIMDEFRPRLREFYYDESRFESYLERLGVEYPTLRPDQLQRIREAEGGGTR